MQSFEYGDWEVGTKEITFSVCSMVIGVGLLSMPRDVNLVTYVADGWISILLGGIFAIIFTYVCAKLAARFPRQTFYEYVASITAKPIAFMLSLLLVCHFLLICLYEVRVISDIAKLYIFIKTPVEVISLVFLMVVVYAVRGSSVGILRLNMMFLPIILFIVAFVHVMSLNTFDINNLRPFFVTPPMNILQGAQKAYLSFAGFEIVLIYISLMNQPQKAPKAAVIGMILPLVMGLLIFLFSIAIFSVTTQEILYPAIEMAKEISTDIGFFERIEALFFTIWIMAIYTTATMAFDAAVLSAKSLFPKLDKIHFVLIFTPIIYLVAMIPRSYDSIQRYGQIASFTSIIFGAVIPTLLLILSLIRRIKGEQTNQKNLKKDA
ncbi:spore germination protein [Pullulanibacillus pueri]|uniref:Germination protein GerLB n=1 Tax=Pullulanibacillus pueri TaxID=1437324 RepID=A0A8J2ZZV8_9BACL|nr:endospore germination permease [Pullulanibacillus pueri]MBM7684149.1 spore germination protein [Pullulanibacillus pueri]GGH88893.1 germination protein GerLB [Pullulanibacillus pueri]